MYPHVRQFPYERTEAMQGVVKFFDDSRGFGFIAPDDGGRDVFVHSRQLAKCGLVTIRDGDRVSFDVGQPKGRPEAVNVQKLTVFGSFRRKLRRRTRPASDFLVA